MPHVIFVIVLASAYVLGFTWHRDSEALAC